MSVLVTGSLIGACVGAALPALLAAQAAPARRAPAATPPPVAACSLLPKEEVKRHLPWVALLDQMPLEEESIGTAGSSCTYPSVVVQVLPFSSGTIDAARRRGGLQTVAGIGDAAYFYENPNGYAELYVQVGDRLLTLQANVDGDLATVKPATLDLARALVAKLR